MKRSAQEIVELVVFGLIALLLGTGLLWLAGWLFGAIGTVFSWLAGLIWALLRFIIPVALVAAVVVLVVRLVRSDGAQGVAPTPAPHPTPAPPTPAAQAPAAPAPAQSVPAQAPEADAAAVAEDPSTAPDGRPADAVTGAEAETATSGDDDQDDATKRDA